MKRARVSIIMEVYRIEALDPLFYVAAAPTELQNMRCDPPFSDVYNDSTTSQNECRPPKSGHLGLDKSGWSQHVHYLEVLMHRALYHHAQVK